MLYFAPKEGISQTNGWAPTDLAHPPPNFFVSIGTYSSFRPRRTQFPGRAPQAHYSRDHSAWLSGRAPTHPLVPWRRELYVRYVSHGSRQHGSSVAVGKAAESNPAEIGRCAIRERRSNLHAPYICAGWPWLCMQRLPSHAAQLRSEGMPTRSYATYVDAS